MIWALHGALGMPQDWQVLDPFLQPRNLSYQAFDLWELLSKEERGLKNSAALLCQEVRKKHGFKPYEIIQQKKPLLLGYSLGGRLALHALLEDPSLWGGAIICSAHPGLRDSLERTERLQKDQQWSRLAQDAVWEEFLKHWNQQPVLAGDTQGLGDRVFLEKKRIAIARSFLSWSLGLQKPLWSSLERIEVPVCWIAGQRDGKFTQLGKQAVDRLPYGELHVIEKAGHRVPWECTEEFSKVMLRFYQNIQSL